MVVCARLSRKIVNDFNNHITRSWADLPMNYDNPFGFMNASSSSSVKRPRGCPNSPRHL